jgi:hypothetical protein
MPRDVIVGCRDPDGVKPTKIDLDQIAPPVQLAEHLLLYVDPRPVTPPLVRRVLTVPRSPRRHGTLEG